MAESVQAKVDQMRELTESVSERNHRIKRLKGEQPVEVTDEMVDRAWQVIFDGIVDDPLPTRVMVRAALRAALETGP